MASLTCVTCYYPVKNKHGNKFMEWFKNTLSVNCPYVFFTNKENMAMIKELRRDLPTHFIELNMEDFITYRYKDRMITNSIHCPSVELNLIWNEKIFLLDRASNVNPFNTDWFLWMDAGICTFRDCKPAVDRLNLDKLLSLPKDKIIYTSSNPYYEHFVTVNNYYHHVSGTYLIHKDIIAACSLLYKEYLEKLLSKDNIWTDQVIWTHIYKDYPFMFYKWFDGYGEIAKYLFGTQERNVTHT